MDISPNLSHTGVLGPGGGIGDESAGLSFPNEPRDQMVLLRRVLHQSSILGNQPVSIISMGACGVRLLVRIQPRADQDAPPTAGNQGQTRADGHKCTSCIYTFQV